MSLFLLKITKTTNSHPLLETRFPLSLTRAPDAQEMMTTISLWLVRFPLWLEVIFSIIIRNYPLSISENTHKFRMYQYCIRRLIKWLIDCYLILGFLPFENSTHFLLKEKPTPTMSHLVQIKTFVTLRAVLAFLMSSRLIRRKIR